MRLEVKTLFRCPVCDGAGQAAADVVAIFSDQELLAECIEDAVINGDVSGEAIAGLFTGGGLTSRWGDLKSLAGGLMKQALHMIDLPDGIDADDMASHLSAQAIDAVATHLARELGRCKEIAA